MTITQELLDTGTISDAAIEELRAQLFSPPSALEVTWDRRWFQLAHFCVLYLPLRYLAWSRVGQENEKTEFEVNRLAFDAEVAIWERASSSQPAGRAFELVFGVDDPTQKCLLNQEIPSSWFRAYRHEVSLLSARWESSKEIDCWCSLAIHYASCQINWIQQRRIDRIPEFQLSLSEQTQGLCNKIRQSVGKESVASVVGAWLHGLSTDRLLDGSPSLGTAREKFLGESVRGVSEVLLLRGHREP